MGGILWAGIKTHSNKHTHLKRTSLHPHKYKEREMSKKLRFPKKRYKKQQPFAFLIFFTVFCKEVHRKERPKESERNN